MIAEIKQFFAPSFNLVEAEVLKGVFCDAFGISRKVFKSALKTLVFVWVVGLFLAFASTGESSFNFSWDFPMPQGDAWTHFFAVFMSLSICSVLLVVFVLAPRCPEDKGLFTYSLSLFLTHYPMFIIFSLVAYAPWLLLGVFIPGVFPWALYFEKPASIKSFIFSFVRGWYLVLRFSPFILSVFSVYLALWLLVFMVVSVSDIFFMFLPKISLSGGPNILPPLLGLYCIYRWWSTIIGLPFLPIGLQHSVYNKIRSAYPELFSPVGA